MACPVLMVKLFASGSRSVREDPLDGHRCTRQFRIAAVQPLQPLHAEDAFHARRRTTARICWPQERCLAGLHEFTRCLIKSRGESRGSCFIIGNGRLSSFPHETGTVSGSQRAPTWTT
jgi:hypothetical protein